MYTVQFSDSLAAMKNDIKYGIGRQNEQKRQTILIGSFSLDSIQPRELITLSQESFRNYLGCESYNDAEGNERQ